MELSTIERIDALVRREVVPATGCTEPVSVALGVAYATSLVEGEVERIVVRLSANMIKNAMGVGIPGTGMIGLPIAIALGYVIGAPERGLTILDGFSQGVLDEAKSLTQRGVIDVELCEDEGIDRLYVEAEVRTVLGERGRSIIEHTHTGIRYLERNGEPVHLSPQRGGEEHVSADCSELIEQQEIHPQDIELSFDLVYRYATEAPLERMTFIYDAAKTNKSVAVYALENQYGHNIGRLVQSASGQRLVGTSPMAKMITYTSAACDARMGGAPLMVVSNSGSGNQGITATLPVLTFAEVEGLGYEQTVRALMLSSLMVIYVKQHLGRLSGLCGMVVSGIGTAAALVYLMGGRRDQSAAAIKNMVGNVTGMICDGAKPSCSLKASTGISSAMIAALLAMEHECCSSIEGIVHDDVDACIRNLAIVGRDGMAETDRKVLELMMHK